MRTGLLEEAPATERGGIERAALGVLVAFTAIALAGYGVFGAHPNLLPATGNAVAIYGAAFVVFARGQIIISALALATLLVRRVGKSWLPAFGAIYVISLASELAGTTVGLPFGPYSYTDGLGPKWFGHVPLLIPLSWFLMAVPSFAIARRLVRSDAPWKRIAVGSFVLLSWDLALDPAMSHATKYWVWGSGTTGPYYGMPWSNLFGWYVTGIALMMMFVVMKSDRWIARLPIGWIAVYYAANLAMSLGIDAAAGLTGAVVASLVPLLACVAALRRDDAVFAVPITEAGDPS